MVSVHKASQDGKCQCKHLRLGTLNSPVFGHRAYKEVIKIKQWQRMRYLSNWACVLLRVIDIRAHSLQHMYRRKPA